MKAAHSISKYRKQERRKIPEKGWMCQLVTLLTDAFLNKLSEVISKICLLKQITHFTSQRKLQALCHSLKGSAMRASSKYRLMSL